MSKITKVRKKLTDKQKKLIIADYIDCGNYSEVARKYKVSDTAVRKIIKADKDSVKKFEQKKEENTKDVLEYMDTLKDRKNIIVNSFTNIKDVASAYGIIIDKELKLKEIKNREVSNEEGVVIIDDLPKTNSKTE